MGRPLAYKIIEKHLVSGEMKPGSEISIRIDYTLTQDSTGTMAYLQFEAMGIPRVKTKKSLAYIDHNILQSGPENADDHKYIATVAKKHGIYFSRPGNGICHQVNLERFGVPGATLLGSDSHTPTGGGIGMIAIGAGGLDVAVAMGGGEYYLSMPKIVNLELKGKLKNGVSAKDVILEVLRIMSVKGGVGRIIEYTGEGVAALSVPERATITNMGTELGATTSIFPSDEVTRQFLAAQGREQDYIPLSADPDAEYDEHIVVDLSTLEPMAACPHMPDRVKTLPEIGQIKVDQVCIGSCTNSSYLDMMRTAAILKGKTVHEDVSLVIAPGSKQVLEMLAENGALADMIAAGARILECGCGPCIGMGQSPKTDGVSLRTSNRNFYARSGTASAGVYLVSPETAAASAIAGHLCGVGDVIDDLSVLDIEVPEIFNVNDNMIVEPAPENNDVEVVRGPNIKEFPINTRLPETVSGNVLLKMEDNITTDHIMPSNAKLLPYRSNVPYLSEYCLTPVDPEFPARAKAQNGGILVAGQNYGQGSSREHAALVPLYLGIKAVVAKSFARIHASNLINSGILPLTFKNEADYEKLSQGNALVIENARAKVEGKLPFTIKNQDSGEEIEVELGVSERLRKILLAGGLLNYTREN
ncbi:MAG: aconitate hydratase [Christensenellaceae bacterium]|nr:aconitate hydratase [Christensenellaceae bacterium]